MEGPCASDREFGFPRSPSSWARGRQPGCGGGGAGGGVVVPRPWLVVVGMRVDVIALHAGGGVLRSGADLVVFRRVVAASLRRRGSGGGAGGGVGVPRSRLVSVGVRVDVVVPRSSFYVLPPRSSQISLCLADQVTLASGSPSSSPTVPPLPTPEHSPVASATCPVLCHDGSPLACVLIVSQS